MLKSNVINFSLARDKGHDVTPFALCNSSINTITISYRVCSL